MTAPTPEDAAKDLVLDLVRTEVSEQPCSSCGRTLEGCRLSVDVVELDRISIEVTCAACERVTHLEVGPSADGGAASIR